MKKVKKAVIPVAGLGTRFLPVTKSIPKEMIPVIDTPLIQLIVEEAIDSGIETIVLVNGRHKEAIENHFDHNYELEHTLSERGKKDLAKVSSDLTRRAEIVSIRQKMPLGLGHAILCAQPVVGDEPFAVLLGDDLIDGKNKPCTKQLVEIFEKENRSVVGVMEVPKEETSKYGIVSIKKEGKLMEVDHLVEKPNPEVSPSCFAIPGRYVLTSKIFQYLKHTKPGAGGEIQLTDALLEVAKNDGLLAYQYEGDRYDAGDRLGYFEAQIAYGLKRPELRSQMIEIMKKWSRT